MNTDIVLMYNADVEMHGGRRGIEMDFTDAAVFGQQMGGVYREQKKRNGNNGRGGKWVGRLCEWDTKERSSMS